LRNIILGYATEHSYLSTIDKIWVD